MNFELTEEQLMLKDMVSKFMVNEIEPITEEMDEKDKFPDDLWSKLAGLGILGINIPEKYGGAGAGLLSAVGGDGRDLPHKPCSRCFLGRPRHLMRR